MIAYIWQNKFRFKKSACFPLSHLPTHARCAPPMSHRACVMSHHASPQSPTLTPLRDRTPGTPGSSGLPASLLRFVARDSPASVIFEKTSRSWDDVRSALGLRHGGPPPGVFQSVRTSPQCSTASCDGWTDEEEEANSAESVRHDGSEFQEQSDDVCFRLDRALLHALRSRLSTMEVDVDVVAQRVTNLERWREDIEDYDVNVDDFEDDDQTTHSIPEKSKGSHVTSSFSPPQKTSSLLSFRNADNLATTPRSSESYQEIELNSGLKGVFSPNTFSSAKKQSPKKVIFRCNGYIVIFFLPTYPGDPFPLSPSFLTRSSTM